MDWPGIFFSSIHFVPLNPSVLFHVTYVPYYCPYTTKTTQTSIAPAGFEPAIPASERPQTHALDRAATGIGYRTRASAVRGRRLMAWAIARLQYNIFLSTIFLNAVKMPSLLNVSDQVSHSQKPTGEIVIL
jgi:hypothetical protein